MTEICAAPLDGYQPVTVRRVQAVAEAIQPGEFVFSLRETLTPFQFNNLTSLLLKSGKHLVALGIEPFHPGTQNPWNAYGPATSSARSSSFRTFVRFGEEEHVSADAPPSPAVLRVGLVNPSAVHASVVIYRMSNLIEWVSMYGQNRKLNTTTPLKTTTWDSITKRVETTDLGIPRSRPQPEDQDESGEDQDESEDESI